MAETKYSEQTRSWHRQVHEINAIRQNEISLFEAENCVKYKGSKLFKRSIKLANDFVSRMTKYKCIIVKYCYNGDKWLYEDDSKDYKANDLLYEVLAFEEV